MAGSERRLDLRPIERRYLRGLEHPRTQRISWSTRATHFILPVTAGLAAGILFPVSASTVGNPLVPAVGLGGALLGGMLAGFVLTLNLRLKLEEGNAIDTSRATRENVSYAAFTFLHLTLCCAAVLIIALPMSMIWAQAAATTAAIALHVGIGLSVALLLHILANAITLVRRIGSAYAALFDKDMRATFRVVRDHDRSA